MKPRAGWEILLDPIAIGALLFGLLAFTIASLENSEDHLLNGAPVAVATITATNLFPGKGSATIDVEFTLPGGRTARATVEDFYDSPRPKPGRQIEVQYRIDGADIYARESGFASDVSDFRLWMGVGIACMLAAVGLPLGHLLRSRRTVG